MFILYAEKNKLHLRQRETLTSGSVNIYPVRFSFSREWNGLKRTAVFKAGSGGKPVSVLLKKTGECVIPWEVLAEPGPLLLGVYGTNESGETVLPTVWVSLGTVLGGAAPGEDAQPPTPDLWQQELAGKADGLDYTPNGSLGLYAGERLLSEVPAASGGASDHRLLAGRDAENQHPIGSIEGLPDALRRIPAPVEPLTNEDLEELLT